MLRFSLDHLFKARSINRPAQFLSRLGFAIGTSAGIRYGTSNVLNLRHIEKLCEALKCTPNDLLEWQPSKDQADTPDHPLAPLRHRSKADQVVQLINNLNYDKLTEIEDLIKNHIQTNKTS